MVMMVARWEGALKAAGHPSSAAPHLGSEQVDALHAQLTERGITAPSPRDAFWGARPL